MSVIKKYSRVILSVKILLTKVTHDHIVNESN